MPETRGNRGGIFAGFGRGNRDAENDGRPGSPDESAAYARIYDVGSETEFTNRPETTTQIITGNQILRGNAGDSSSDYDDRSSVKFFPSVGKFIIPRENTWAAHEQLIKNPEQGLAFNPAKYVYFDAIIAQHFPQILDPKYEGLRNNIAVMRNDTIGMYLKDGSFDPGDEKYIPYIAGVAHGIGQLLENDAWYKRLLNPHVDRDVANVEGVGAREIYKALLERQVAPSRWNDLKVILGDYDRSWGLPPIEATPYSDLNLSAPPPQHVASELNGQSSKFRDAYLNERNSALAGPIRGW